MRLSKRPQDRKRTRAQYRPRLEALETRICLSCDLVFLDDGTLQIIGTDAPEIVHVEDLGNGNVSVLCQDRGDERGPPRLFSGVTALWVDLKGGDDAFSYSSVQDVNAALPRVEVWLGEGDDTADVDVVLTGTPDGIRELWVVVYAGRGIDTLQTSIATLTSSDAPTQPVVRGGMYGGEGRDELMFVSSTPTGGFQLSSKELGPSVANDPDCMIWDLIDGTSGEVEAQVMGSSANNEIVLRSDERGIGRKNFNFLLDGGGGVNALNSYLTFTGETNGKVETHNGAEQTLRIDGIVQLEVNAKRKQSLYFPEHMLAEIQNQSLTLDFVGTDEADTVQIKVGDNELDHLAINVDTRGGDDDVEVELDLRAGASASVMINGGFGHDRITSHVLGNNLNNVEVEMQDGEDTRLSFESDDLVIAATALSQADGPAPTKGYFMWAPGSYINNLNGSGNQVIFSATGFNDVDLDLDLRVPDTTVQIGMLLPAIQKVRDAAARLNLVNSGEGNAIYVRVDGYPTFDFNLTAPKEPVKIVTIEYLVLGVAVHPLTFTADVSLEASGIADLVIAVAAVNSGKPEHIDVLSFSFGFSQTSTFVASGTSCSTLEVSGFAQVALSLNSDDVSLDFAATADGNDGLRDAPTQFPVKLKVFICPSSHGLESISTRGVLELTATGYGGVDVALGLSGDNFDVEMSIIGVDTRSGRIAAHPAARANAQIDVGGSGNQVNFGATGLNVVDLGLNLTGHDNSVHIGIEWTYVTLNPETGSGVLLDAFFNFGSANGVVSQSLELVASNFTGSIAMQASQRRGEFLLTLDEVELSGDMDVIVDGFRDVSRTIDGMHIHAGGSYRETIRAADDRQRLPKGFGFVAVSDGMHIAEGGECHSLLVGGRAATHVESRLVNVVNHGLFEKTVQTGDGADTVWQSLDGFANYGTARFDTQLGAGADTYVASVRGLYVAPHASFFMLIDAGAGQDTILAYTQATVDGHYRFEARGGSGNDHIVVVQEFSAGPRSGGPVPIFPPPQRTYTIETTVAGDTGNDWLELRVLAPDIDEDLINALVDGGPGRDTACVHGPVHVVNVEHFCHERDENPVQEPGRVEFPNLVFHLPRADGDVQRSGLHPLGVDDLRRRPSQDVVDDVFGALFEDEGEN